MQLLATTSSPKEIKKYDNIQITKYSHYRHLGKLSIIVYRIMMFSTNKIFKILKPLNTSIALLI